MFSGGLKLSDDEDDDFVVGSENGISNLSNIFGIAVEKPNQKNTPSLRYISPKQTKPAMNSGKETPKDASTEGTQDWIVQVAKVVTAFKLLNKENISQGKIGLAVLKNTLENRFRLILYRSKNNVLSTCTIKHDTVIYRNNLYLQFHDDLQLFWSILFQMQDLDEVLTFIGNNVKIRENQESSDRLQDPVTDKQKVSTSETEKQGEENIPQKSQTPVSVTTEHKNKEIGENSSDERLRDTKASILSRMAKMGQPLPKLHATANQATTTDVSDSSDNESKTRMVQKPMVIARKPKVQSLVPVMAANMQMVAPASVGYSNFMATSSTGLAAPDSQYLNILVAENRTRNSEVRMNISKLETKIERVLDKIDFLANRNEKDNRASKEDEILVLEEKVVELKKENRSLKQQILQLEENHQSNTAKSEREEDYSEVASLLEKYQIEFVSASEPSDVYKQLIHQLHSEVTTTSHALTDAQMSLETAKKETQTETEKLANTNSELKETISEQDVKILSLSQKLADAENENSELSKQLKDQPAKVDQLVKQIMNNLYEKLSEQFSRKDTFTASEVTKICATTIKNETNNVIKKK